MITRKTMRHTIAACIAVACAFAMICALFVGCSSGKQESGPSQASSTPATAEKTLKGKTLNIYCGAGMTNPFQEIAKAFEEQTGCKVNVTYANAAQIQTQISTTEQGDFFIAGSVGELKPIESYVSNTTELVKHIPVLAVPANNPKNVSGLADLKGCDRVLIGDPESTPIGKIAKKALAPLGFWDELMNSGVITTTTTAPQIATALANGEGDAGIVWKENVKDGGAKIVATSDLDDYIKAIPAARLTCCAEAGAADAFSDFLQTGTAWDIWAQFGYERA